MPRWMMYTAVMAVLGLLPVVAAAGYTGDLYGPGGTSPGLVDGSGWNGWLAWDVTQVTTPGTYYGWWLYKYSLATWVTSGGGGNISHVVVEVSPATPAAAFRYWTSAFTPSPSPPTQAPSVGWSVPDYSSFLTPTSLQLDTWGSEGKSNPGIPEEVYGLKLAGSAAGMNWAILAYRRPVWGDFYAKDGGSGDTAKYLFNKGFTTNDTDPTDAVSSGSVAFHVVVPDTTPSDPVEPPETTPELSAALLLLVGLLPAGVAWRRRRGP